MIKEYTPSHKVEEIIYRVRFDGHENSRTFECDENGNLLPDTSEELKKSYEWCMHHPEKFPYAFNEIEKDVRKYKEPATGICNCGHKIYLQNEYLGACECPECGQWWNLFGQELKPLSQWNDNGELDYEY